MIVLATCLMSMSAYGQKSMPYMEGFENMSSTADLTTDGWSTAQSTSGAFIQPTTDYANSGSKSMLIDQWDCASSSDYHFVILPEITGTLSTARIGFWWKGGLGTLEIGYLTNGTDVTSFVSLFSQSASISSFTKVMLNLDDVPSTATRLVLKVTGYYRYYLDDLVVEQQPTCGDLITSNTLSLANITASSANVTLNDTTVTDWEYVYGAPGFDPSTATPVLVQGTRTATITGLSDATTYEVRARRYCSATDQGAWSSAATFATQCLIADSPLFLDDFESGIMNICWSTAYLENPGSKTVAPFAVYSSASYSHNSSYCCKLNDMTAGTISTLSTQQLPIDSANKYEIVVWVNRASDSKANEGIKFWASPVANDTTNATLLGYIHRCMAYSPVETTAGYYKYNMPITVAGDLYIVLEGISEYGQATYFDDFQVRKIPTCFDIAGTVTASGITSNSAVLAIADSTVTNWDIAYGVQGTDRDSCTVVTATGLTHTLTGLTDDTFYDVYIRRNCGNEFGEWTNAPVTFRTLCLPVTSYPYIEDFEGETTGARLGGCYTSSSRDTYGDPSSYYQYSVLTSSATTYNHTAGGSKYAGQAYSATGTSIGTSRYVSKTARQFQLDQTKFYEISFWAHRYSTYSNVAGIVMGNTADFDSLQFIYEENITTGDWVNVLTYVQVPASGVYSIGVGTKPYNDASGALAFDDFMIREVTCIPPTGLKAENITSNSANIAFNTNAPVSCIIVDTDEANITAGTGTTYSNNNITASPVALTGLQPQTTYYYAMRTINGTDTSVWTRAYSFTTTCTSDALPFTEDFESEEAGIVGGCWKYETTGSYVMKYLSGNPMYNHTEEGTMGVTVVYSATSTSRTFTSSPFGLYRRFALTAGANYQMIFYAKKYSSVTDYSYDMSLVYSNNGTGFDSAAMTVASTVRVDAENWAEYKMYFTAPATGDYWVGLQAYNNGNSYYFHVDDITLKEVTVLPPSDVTVSNIAQTTATMNITSPASMWQVAIDTIAEEVTYARVYNNVVTTNTVSLTGLTDGTTYYYAVRAINGTDTSDWSMTRSFSTMCFATTSPFTDDFEDAELTSMLAGCYWQGGIFEEGAQNYYFKVLDDFAHSGEQAVEVATKTGDGRTSMEGTVYAYRQFALETGKTYEVSMWGIADANTSWGDYSFNMDLFYGTVQDYDSMTLIATRNINGGVWMQNRAYITVPATGNYYIGFATTNNSLSGSYVHVDDFTVKEVTCIPPTNHTVTAVTPTTATFDFGTTATKFEVAIDTVEIDLMYEVATSVYQDTVYTATPTVTNLIAGLNYYYTVRTICADGDTSDWAEIGTFSLPCQPTALPFFEDFESYDTEEEDVFVESCYNTEGQQYGVFNGSSFNHTANGINGMATAKMNSYYGGGTYVSTSMFKGGAGIYRYISLEAGKTYESAVFTKSSSNVRNYYFDMLIGTVADHANMTTIMRDSVVNSSNWFEMKGTFTVPTTGAYFIGYYTEILGEAAGFTPYFDDIAIYEVATEEYYDTICFGVDYAGHGFNVAASNLEEGENTLTRSVLDSVAGLKTTTTVNLFVYNEVMPSTENMTICSGTSYTWHNMTLTAAGVYNDTIANMNGCDSICTLNLSVLDKIERFDTVTYCQNEIINLVAAYDEPGTYDIVDSLVAAGGCDSIIYTHMTIYPSYAFITDTTIVNGESIEWQGETITAAGTYNAAYQTENGCDSVYVLNVSVVDGVENISMANINVVPNPVKAGATTMVYSNAENIEHVEILNNLGQVITSFVPQSNPIEVRGIEVSGIYFVRVVTTEGDAYVEKLIVK